MGYFLTVCLVATGLGVIDFCAETAEAQAQTKIAQAAAKACAVMSGQRKADAQTLQYLLLLDEDLADPNPVAISLYQEVMKQCPKTYLNYQQRKIVRNPFPPGSLVKQGSTQLTQNSTQLTKSASEYPLRCHGAHGMASASGRNLVVVFRKGERPANQELQPGQCSWLDRGVRPNEATRIVDERPNIDEARITAEHINAGDTWTFWVVNAGAFYRATTGGRMIVSGTDSALAIKAWGGAADGAVLRLFKGCTSENPDCTWTYRQGMLISDQDPTLAINAWGGAAHGTVLKLFKGCTPSNPDCTWTYHQGMFLSDRNPALAIDAWGGAKHGTVLRLYKDCPQNSPDCTWKF